MSKVAIITGVRRIGFYIAQFLLSQGYNLAVLYRSSLDRVDDLKEYAERSDKEVLPFKVDLSKTETYTGVPKKVFKHFGRIDVLLNIASPFGAKKVFETSEEDIDFYHSVIVKAPYLLSLESAKYMLKNNGSVKGRIINFGDWSTVVGNPYKNFAPYLVAKGGLDTLTKVFAVEFAPDILVNEIALGPVLPPMMEDKEKTNHWRNYIESKTLLRKPVGIEDILSAVDFFLKAKSVTGEILILDSGQRFVGKGY
jgi:pteridine reductase